MRSFGVLVFLRRFEPSNLLAAVALLLPLGSCVGLTFLVQSKAIETRQQVDETMSVLGVASRLSSAILQAESSQRGYLLTRDPSYREPFAEAVEATSAEVANLGKLAQRNRDEIHNFPQLAASIDNKLRELTETLSLADQGRWDDALKLVKSNVGINSMQSAMFALGDIRREHVALLNERKAAVGSDLRRGMILTSSSAAFAVIGWGSSLWLASRESRRRRTSEAAMVESEARYRTLADNATDMILLQDEDRKKLYVSPASRRMLGYEPDELADLSAEAATHPDDIEGYLSARGSLTSENRHADSMLRLRRKDGDYLWVEATMQFIPGSERVPARILNVIRDISERKRAEDAAARLQLLLNDAIDAMQDRVALYDSNDRLVLMNAALLDGITLLDDVYALGRTYEEIVRRYWARTEVTVTPEELEALIVRQVAHHREGDGQPDEIHTQDDRWFFNRHFRTRDGGVLTVSTDVTAIKRAAADVEMARDTANAANMAKSAFLASMSHEIRTPMNGVIGFADLLLDSRLTDEQREDVQRIRDAGKSLLALINDILDISKIEAGKLELETIAMSPVSVLDGAISIVKSQIVAKGLALRIEQQPDLPSWISGDPTRVRQILLNLLSNALKFTDSGEITVRCERAGSAEGPLLRFEVRDTGIGIPPDRQQSLFQDFSQIDRSTTRRYGGTGLGLSICKRLAEAMGGEIGVVSTPGGGSTFWFSVTLAEVAAPAETTEEAVPQSNDAPARILVADDLPMNQLIVEGMLRAAGHEVTLVDNGVDAVAALTDQTFDLVLMDMEMPEMDGLSATRAIRALEGPRSTVPVIALTANAMLEDATACKQAGMNDFLAKPIERAQLLALVSKWALPSPRVGGTVPMESNGGSVLDEAVLSQLIDLLGEEQVAGVARMFRSRIGDVRPVLKGEDRAALARGAHDLISLAGNIGCTELAELSRTLLSAVKKGSPKIVPLAEAVTSAADRALTALDARFVA